MPRYVTLIMAMAIMASGCRLAARPVPAGVDLSPMGADPTPNRSSKCGSYEDNYFWWGVLAAAAGVMSGSSGIGTLAPEDDQEGFKLALGFTSIGLGALSAASVFATQHYGRRYTEDCTIDITKQAQP